jgi:flagellar biosynthesis anti-sigma factor FlgM
MRVDFNNFAAEWPDSNQSGRAGQARTARSSAASATTADASSETSLGKIQVPTLAAQVLAQPEVRTAKVQSLQDAIESGEYSVVPSQVADAMASEFGAVGG